MMEHNLAIPNKRIDAALFSLVTGWRLIILTDRVVVVGNCTQEQAQEALDSHTAPTLSNAEIELMASKDVAIAKLAGAAKLTADEAKLLIG